MNNLDKQYTDLLKTILEHGVDKKDRTGTGTKSIFGYTIRHNMKDGFPLLTTKKMPFKTIVTELLWFLRGDTNIKYLVDNNCHIWDGDAYKNYRMNVQEYEKLPNDNDVKSMKMILDSQGNSHPSSVPFNQEEFIDKIKTDDEFAEKWGELGPIYGKQWRKWSVLPDKYGAYNRNPIDQIQNLINDLKTNPDSRRLMVNAWNVGELDQCVLPPCHYGFQVYTRELDETERVILMDKKLGVTENLPAYYTEDEMVKYNIPTRTISLMWNQRSCDLFLGIPFNIASYGLLLEIIAKEVNMVPDQLIGSLGDVHLYSNHIEQAKEQIGRELTFDEFWNSLTPKQKGSMEKPYEGETYNGIDSRIELMNIMSEIHNISTRTREPFPLPTLKFRPCPITGISMEYQSIDQFEIENYQSHPTIKAPLSN